MDRKNINGCHQESLTVYSLILGISEFIRYHFSLFSFSNFMLFRVMIFYGNFTTNLTQFIENKSLYEERVA